MNHDDHYYTKVSERMFVAFLHKFKPHNRPFVCTPKLKQALEPSLADEWNVQAISILECFLTQQIGHHSCVSLSCFKLTKMMSFCEIAESFTLVSIPLRSVDEE